MEQYKKFTKNVLLVGISTFLVGLEGILLLPILTKFLGPTNYGIWSQIKVTLSLIGPIVFLGLTSSLVRFLTGIEDKKKISKNVCSVSLFIIFSGLIFSFLLFIFSKQLSFLLLKTYDATIYFQAGSFLLFFRSIAGIISPILRFKERFGILSLSKVLLSIFDIILIYLFLSYGFGILGVVLGYSIAKLLMIFFEFIFAKRFFSFVKPSFKVLKKSLSYGFPLTFIPLFQWIFQVGDQYILGFYGGANVVGLYALAYSLSYILRTLASPVYTILQTSLTKSWNKGDMPTFRSYFRYSYKYLFLILIPAAFGIIFLAEPIIRIISTPEFMESAKLLPIIIPGILLFTLINFSNNILSLENKTKEIRNLFFFLAVSNIILNLILVPMFSLYGAAIATLITFIISGIYSLRVINRHKIGLMPLFFLKSIFASSIMGIFIIYARKLHLNAYTKVGIIIFFSIIIYFVIMWILKTFKKEEVKFLKSLIRLN